MGWKGGYHSVRVGLILPYPTLIPLWSEKETLTKETPNSTEPRDPVQCCQLAGSAPTGGESRGTRGTGVPQPTGGSSHPGGSSGTVGLQKYRSK